MRIVKVVFAVFLLMGMLASCSQPPDNTTEPPLTAEKLLEEHCYSEQIRQLLAKNEPYSLEFVSNGDGTCYVSKLYLNNLYASPFDIIIPEKSPAGDVVTGIDLGDSLINSRNMLPPYMTIEQLKQIEAKVDTDYPNNSSLTAGDWWVNAYYEFDISKSAPEDREKIIEEYPLTQYMTFAQFSPKMSNSQDTLRRIRMIGLTPRVATQYYLEFLQEAITAGVPIEMLLETIPVYKNCSEQVRYLHIPSTVNSINTESLNYLMFDFGVDGVVPTRGVVLPELGFETTEAIVSALKYLGGKYNFVVFSLCTSAEGYEDIRNFAIYSTETPEADILAWHYVDGVPTLWE